MIQSNLMQKFVSGEMVSSEFEIRNSEFGFREEPRALGPGWLLAVGLLILGLVAPLPVRADITVNRTFTVNQDVPDRGQYVDTRQITNAGLATITDVNVGLNLGSASGSTMRLGQLYSTVTVGTASEGSRTAVLLNREGVSNTSAFGSAISFLNVTFDDSAATNIYQLTSGTGTWSAYPLPVAYTYAWYRCTASGSAAATLPSSCTVDLGVSASSYTPVIADFGQFLRVKVTATNDAGTSSYV